MSETSQSPEIGSDTPVEKTTASPAGEPSPPAQPSPVPEPITAGPGAPTELDVQVRALLSLLVIGLVVYLAFSWRHYQEQFPQSSENWRVGSRQTIELTLIHEDIQRLACASDTTKDGLACTFKGDQKAREPAPPEGQLVRPYCTVKNEQLLAAGLWDSPGMKGPLPKERFSVVCDYDILAIVKSAALRWSPTDKLEPAKQSLPFGKLTNCVIPQ